MRILCKVQQHLAESSGAGLAFLTAGLLMDVLHRKVSDNDTLYSYLAIDETRR